MSDAPVLQVEGLVKHFPIHGGLLQRRVGEVSAGNVPAYTSVDARYGWHLGRAFELAVIGQNLFDNRHLEYASDFFASQLSYQPRRGYIQGLWRF